MKRLFVYRWRGFRNECPPSPNGSKQTREIVAVTSVAAAHRAFNASGVRCSISDVREYGSETGNAEELEVALAEPGVVFWRPLDHRGEGGWTRTTHTETATPTNSKSVHPGEAMKQPKDAGPGSDI
jgi:hypothetical protein